MREKKLNILVSLCAFSFFVFILYIIYLADTNKSSIFFDFVKSIPYGDKLGHIGLFGLLTFLVSWALKFKAVTFKKVKIYYGAILVFSFAFLEELSQAFYPNRTLDIYDLFADIIGIVLFSILLNSIEKKVKNDSSYSKS